MAAAGSVGVRNLPARDLANLKPEQRRTPMLPSAFCCICSHQDHGVWWLQIISTHREANANRQITNTGEFSGRSRGSENDYWFNFQRSVSMVSEPRYSWQLLRCGESTTPTLGSYSKAIRLLCLSLCLELI